MFDIDSGLDSELIQDDVQFGTGATSPTVEDGTQQDDIKNGQLGKFCLNFTFVNFFFFFHSVHLFVLFYFKADADVGDESGTADEG